MTYQKPIPNSNYDNNADANEASSLVLTAVVDDASPSSFSFGHDGVATKNKNEGRMRRAVIATCFVLGFVAVVLYGGGRSRQSHMARSTGGLSAALLRGPNPAASVDDFCYQYCLAFGLAVDDCKKNTCIIV